MPTFLAHIVLVDVASNMEFDCWDGIAIERVCVLHIETVRKKERALLRWTRAMT